MAAPVRVLMLLEDLCFGGTQRQAVEMAARFDPERVRPCLRVLLQGDDFAPLARERGLDVQWLTRSRRLGPAGLAALWRCLRRERPDVLLLLTALPNIWGRLLARLDELLPDAPCPVVVGNIRQSGAPARYHERWLKNLAHHHVCNAASLRRQLQQDFGLPAGRVSVIHNGVDVERFRPAAAGTQQPLLVVSAGRLVPDKDQKTLLRAFALVARELPEVRLQLYGEGPLFAELQQQAAAMPADTVNRVALKGGRAGLEDVYPRAGLFALSSLREGLPNVVLEAMACGLPVVATAVDGVPELVAHGDTGLLTPPGDVEALAAAMLELLQDPARRREMGTAARRRVVEAFSYESAARAHEALFEQLTRKEGACSSSWP